MRPALVESHKLCSESAPTGGCRQRRPFPVACFFPSSSAAKTCRQRLHGARQRVLAASVRPEGCSVVTCLVQTNQTTGRIACVATRFGSSLAFGQSDILVFVVSCRS